MMIQWNCRRLKKQIKKAMGIVYCSHDYYELAGDFHDF
jgi:hypothetical protein